MFRTTDAVNEVLKSRLGSTLTNTMSSARRQFVHITLDSKGN